MKETLIERRIQELAFKSTFLSMRGWVYSFDYDNWQTTDPTAISYFIDFDLYSIIEDNNIRKVSVKLEEAFNYEFYRT